MMTTETQYATKDDINRLDNDINRLDDSINRLDDSINRLGDRISGALNRLNDRVDGLYKILFIGQMAIITALLAAIVALFIKA